MYYIAFEEIIKEISEQNNIHLELNGALGCILKMNSGIDVTLELHPIDSEFAIICSLGGIPDGETGIRYFIDMLKDNDFPHDSGILGFDVNRQIATLHAMYDIDNFVISDFMTALSKFEQKAVRWTQTLKAA